MFSLGDIKPYSKALYQTSYAAISAEPMTADTNLVHLMNILLALYAVVFFASIAGIVGSFFIDQKQEDKEVLSASGLKLSVKDKDDDDNLPVKELGEV